MDEENLALVERLRPGNVREYLKFPTSASRFYIARYLYMYQYSGTYLDTDFRCRRPINEEPISNQCILGVEEDDAPELGGGRKFGNAFIASQRGLTLWAELVDSIFTRFRKGEHCNDGWSLSGPYALNIFLRNHKQHGEIVTILPPNVLYRRRTKFYLTAAHDPETTGVHLMWGSWCHMSASHKVKNRVRRILSVVLEPRPAWLAG